MSPIYVSLFTDLFQAMKLSKSLYPKMDPIYQKQRIFSTNSE